MSWWSEESRSWLEFPATVPFVALWDNAVLETRGVGEQARTGTDRGVSGLERTVEDRVVELSVQLRSARERLSRFAGASFMGQLVHRGGILLEANDRLLDMVGYTRDELLGQPIVDLVTDEASHALIRQRIRLGLDGSYFVTGVSRDGRRFPVELEVQPGVFEGQEVRVVTVRDITDRETDVAALRENEARLMALMESVFEGVVVVERGLITEANDGAERLLERPRETLLGYEWAQLLGAELEEPVPSSASLMGSVPPSSGARALPRVTAPGVFRHQRAVALPDGRLLPIDFVEVPAVVDGRSVEVWGLSKSALDVTEPGLSAALEPKQLWDGQKSETVALMTAGLSHDLNNLLVGVLGNAELADAAARSGTDPRPFIAAMRVAAERASELATRMVHYASPTSLSMGPVGVDALLEETVALARVGVSKAARVSRGAATETHAGQQGGLYVRGDAGRLSQLLLNLIMNAVDALSGGGTVDINATDCPVLPDGLVEYPAQFNELGYVKLTIEDNGSGMDEVTLQRAFEPFFSTKYQGSGMGLATCQGIIRQHQGGLGVTSQLGRGTRFEVFLPRDAMPAERSMPPACAVQQPELGWRGSGRVLIVDDEPMVARLTGMVLEHFGLSPTIEHSGVSALEQLVANLSSDSGERFRLVLVDFTMPDLSGNEVLERVRRLCPTLPVVLTSGFSRKEVQSRGMNDGFSGFLQKPYRMAAMVEVLRDALRSD